MTIDSELADVRLGVTRVEMDDLVVFPALARRSLLEKFAVISIPRGDEGKGLDCCAATPVPRLENKSYKEWMESTPVRLGGMGMRAIVETSLEL